MVDHVGLFVCSTIVAIGVVVMIVGLITDMTPREQLDALMAKLFG